MTARKTQLDIGELLPPEEIKDLDLFPAEEGAIKLVFGKIRNGKSTYTARMMYEWLQQGYSVYSNLALILQPDEFDQRLQFSTSLENLVFGKKVFYRFRTENFHYFNPRTGMMKTGMSEGLVQVFDPLLEGDEVRWLNSLTDCKIAYDEGHWLLDSYSPVAKISIGIRAFISESGHCNREVVIITQRVTAIQAHARSNVNQFFQCEKHMFLFIFMRLQVTEYQTLKNDLPDPEEAEKTMIFWTNDKFWKLFDTHTLRNGRLPSQELYVDAYWVPFSGRVRLVLMNLFGRRKGAPLQGEPLPASEVERASQARFEAQEATEERYSATFDIPKHPSKNQKVKTLT